jgi:hypothetical protein
MPVTSSLEDWAKCGFTPDLVFSVRGIPHAKRVQTLTHQELIKEWHRSGGILSALPASPTAARRMILPDELNLQLFV